MDTATPDRSVVVVTIVGLLVLAFAVLGLCYILGAPSEPEPVREPAVIVVDGVSEREALLDLAGRLLTPMGVGL